MGSPSLPIRDQKLADAACGGSNLSCKPISGTGICTYDDGDDDTPAPAPSTDDDPAPGPTPTDDDPAPSQDDDPLTPPADDDKTDDDSQGDDDRACEDAGSKKKCGKMAGCHWCTDGLNICLKKSWPCP